MKKTSIKTTINCAGHLLDLSSPIVMGILNLTPDSFYDGGKYNDKNKILERAEQILNEGGQIIDIGAVSTRPEANEITEKEELKRLTPSLEVIRQKFPEAIISVDTYRANVAKIVIENFDVNIINDISGGAFDEKMFEIIADKNIPYILMHIKGRPENMQKNPSYEDILKEINLYFAEKIHKLYSLGVKDIIIDPGFGFGKTIKDNFFLLNNLSAFEIFDLPILVGLSRKSMIYKTLNITPEEAQNGTTVLQTIALSKGASIIRTHDVKQAVENIKLVFSS